METSQNPDACQHSGGRAPSCSARFITDTLKVFVQRLNNMKSLSSMHMLLLLNLTAEHSCCLFFLKTEPSRGLAKVSRYSFWCYCITGYPDAYSTISPLLVIVYNLSTRTHKKNKRARSSQPNWQRYHKIVQKVSNDPLTFPFISI